MIRPRTSAIRRNGQVRGSRTVLVPLGAAKGKPVKRIGSRAAQNYCSGCGLKKRACRCSDG